MQWRLLSILSGVVALALWGPCRQNLPDAFTADAEAYGEVGAIALDAVDHLEHRHYRIRTPTATYLLDSASGGLSSMTDVEGHDWIGFRPEPWGAYPASAASAYRGVPNLVFGGRFDGVERVLYMLQVEPDTLVDHYSLLGDDTVGIYSADGMVVAGFGRAPGATPLLRTPNRFVIGFIEGHGASVEAYRRMARLIDRPTP